MDNLLERLPSGSRIAVIRLRSLGDCILTTPALSLLKNHRPDLKISVLVEPPFAAVFAVAVVLIFKRPVASGLFLGAAMVLLYLPMSYYMDRALYNRRQRRKTAR